MTRKGRTQRIFAVPNLVSALVAIVVFYLSLVVSGTNRGVVVAGVIAAASGAVAWFVLAYFTAGPSLARSLRGLSQFGAIPIEDAGPAPTLDGGEVADRYTAVLREIEGGSSGRVLLVTSPAPGQGASSVALNLSIAATRAGRRVMLVDADPSPHGIGRFLSSGSTPGLSEIAKGEVDLADATRMWTLEDGTRFPMIPAGEELADTADLAGVLVADAFDVVSEHADLILIDVPPVMWSTATPELGAHADGSILVLTDSAHPVAVSEAIDHLDTAGAPVIGYVRNRTKDMKVTAPHWLRRTLIRTASFALLLLLGYSLYTGGQLLASWNRVETAEFETEMVEEALATDEAPPETAAPEDVVVIHEDEEPAEPVPTVEYTPTGAYETMLLIGNDEIGGTADVILFLVWPTNGADPFMVSLPRDLYVENPCTGGNTRINTLIKGCTSKDINGPTLLSYKVEQITGIQVDHFAWFNFDGFVEVIDSVGGVELCFEYAVRDTKAKLDMPAGCTQADGEQTLSWVRSRHTQENRDGGWYTMSGAGDLQRNQHQQEVLLQLFAKLKDFQSPQDLTTKVASVADAFTVDEGFSLAEAVSFAWTLRGIDLEDIIRLELPMRLTRSDTDQSVIVMTQPFDEYLAEVYGDALPVEDGSSDGDESAAQEDAAGAG